MKFRGLTRQPSVGHDGSTGIPSYSTRWNVYDSHEEKSHFSNHNRKSYDSNGNINENYGNHYNHGSNNGNEEEPGRWWQSGEDELSATSSVLNIHIREKQWRPSMNYTAPVQHSVGYAGPAKQSHPPDSIPLFIEDDEYDDENTVGNGVVGRDIIVIGGSCNLGEHGAENKEENWLDYGYRYNCKSNNTHGLITDSKTSTNKNNGQYSRTYSAQSAYGRFPLAGGDGDVERGNKRKPHAPTSTVTVVGGERTQPLVAVGGVMHPHGTTGTAMYTASRMRYTNSNNYTSSVYSTSAVDHPGNCATARETSFPTSQPTTTTLPTLSSTVFEAAAAGIIAAAGLPLSISSLANYILEGQPRLPPRPSTQQQQGNVERNYRDLMLRGNSTSSQASPPPYCYSSVSDASSLNTAHFPSTAVATNNVHMSVWTSRSRGSEQSPPPIVVKHVPQLSTGAEGPSCHPRQPQTKAYSEYLSDLLYFHADFFPPPSPPRGLPFTTAHNAPTTRSSLYSPPLSPSGGSPFRDRRAALWYHYAGKWNITHRLPPPPRTPLPEMREHEELRRRGQQPQQRQWRDAQRQRKQPCGPEAPYSHSTRRGPACTPYDISGWMEMCERWFDVAQRQFNYPPENVPVRVSPGFVLRHVAQC